MLGRSTRTPHDRSVTPQMRVRAFTLSQQKRRAESRCSVRPALSELFVCGAASDHSAASPTAHILAEGDRTAWLGM
jgi:hypothetical protein